MQQTEIEEVDFDLLLSLVDEDDENSVKLMENVMAAISGLTDGVTPEVEVGGAESRLIDKFLELKELRIVAAPEDGSNGNLKKCETQPTIETPSVELSSTFEDEGLSEELAQIYLNQGLYSEANDIYNRLFLLYSEKSVYFARQIEKISELTAEGRSEIEGK